MSTQRALQRVMDATRVNSVLDVGCGPGMQTMDLAAAAQDARITALDINGAYLDQLSSRIRADGQSGRIGALRASMFALPVHGGSIDVIWCEGAIYLIGFERGLREWKPLLRRHGCLAATHLSWLRRDAPAEPRTFWAKHFPAMASVEENLSIARRSGYEVLDHFTLPESAWWDYYYGPLERRLTDLRIRHQGDDEARAELAGTQEQIDLYRSFSAFYGYVFYVLQAL